MNLPVWHWVITTILASSVPIILGGGLYYRYRVGKGIGWQFIRYTVLGVSLPIIGVLALHDTLTSEAATLIGTAIGFAFGKTGEAD